MAQRIPKPGFEHFLRWLRLLREIAQQRAAVLRQLFQVEHLCIHFTQHLQQAAFAGAGCAANDLELKLVGQLLQFRNDMPTIGLVTATEFSDAPADLSQNVRHCATALAAAPAIDQRVPALGFVAEQDFHVLRNVVRYQRCAIFLCLERRNLGIHRADEFAFCIAQYRRTDRAGDMIFGIFGGRTHVDDVVVIGELCYGSDPYIFHIRSMSEPVKLTRFSHGGGCGCKIAPAVLAEMLAAMPSPPSYPNLLVGTESGDDAAVYKLNDNQAIVVTTDFFMPIVDDARDFGRIAAANALSDVYAMGASPILALALVGMPVDKLPLEIVRDILAGGASMCEEACVALAGGHSIDAPEPIYGLAVVGVAHPDHIRRNDSAQEGDVLILGKPLGIGVLSAALKKGELDEDGYRQMVATATHRNRVGVVLGTMPQVHAMTDVTGFALPGHLLEICRGSKLGAEIDFCSIPVLPSALQLAQQGYSTGAAERNWNSYGAEIELAQELDEWQRKLLCDPQTSGGLLVACSPDAVDDVLKAFHAEEFAEARVIGGLRAGQTGIRVRA